jgi:hypothetical protein
MLSMIHRLLRFALADLDAVDVVAQPVLGDGWRFEVFSHPDDDEWGGYEVTYCATVDEVRAIPDVSHIYAKVAVADIADLPSAA